MRPFVLFACFFAPVLAAHAAADVHVELRDCAAACREPLRLGDVAHLRTADLPTMRALAALPVRDAGFESAAVGRRELAERIARAIGIDPQRIVWSGRDSIPARAAPQATGSREVEQAATDALRSWLAHRGTQATVAAQPLHDLRLPAGSFDLRPRIGAAQPMPRMVVWVDAWLAGAFVRTVPVSFSVDVYRDSAAQLPAPAPQARAGRRVRPVAAVAPDSSRPPAEVSRGEWVDLRYASAGLELVTRAEALEEGRAGEPVRVRVAGAAQPLQARVVARGAVEALP